MKLVTDSEEIEVGDIVRLVKEEKTIVEGEIEFIDFSIPMGIVMITIKNETYSTGFCDTYLIKQGRRTAEQRLLKRDRERQVDNRKKHLDKGGSF